MRCSVYLPVCEPGRAPRLATGPAPSPPKACPADGRCLLTPCRAERDSLESTLLDTQRLSGQLQAEREQLEGETQSLRLARQTLQGALGGLHVPPPAPWSSAPEGGRLPVLGPGTKLGSGRRLSVVAPCPAPVLPVQPSRPWVGLTTGSTR